MSNEQDALALLARELQKMSSGDLLVNNSALGNMIPQSLKPILSNLVTNIIPLQSNANMGVGIHNASASLRTNTMANNLMPTMKAHSAGARNNVMNKFREMSAPLLKGMSKEDQNLALETMYDLTSMTDPGLMKSLSGMSSQENIAYGLAKYGSYGGINYRDKRNSMKRMNKAFEEAVYIRDEEGNVTGENKAATGGLSGEDFASLLAVGKQSGIFRSKDEKETLKQAKDLGGAITSVRMVAGQDTGVETALRLAEEVTGTIGADSGDKIKKAFGEIAALLDVAGTSGEELLSRADSIKQMGGSRMTSRDALKIAQNNVYEATVMQNRDGKVNAYDLASRARRDTEASVSNYSLAADVKAMLGIEGNIDASNSQAFNAMMEVAINDPERFNNWRGGMTEEQKAIAAEDLAKQQYKEDQRVAATDLASNEYVRAAGLNNEQTERLADVMAHAKSIGATDAELETIFKDTVRSYADEGKTGEEQTANYNKFNELDKTDTAKQAAIAAAKTTTGYNVKNNSEQTVADLVATEIQARLVEEDSKVKEEMAAEKAKSEEMYAELGTLEAEVDPKDKARQIALVTAKHKGDGSGQDNMDKAANLMDFIKLTDDEDARASALDELSALTGGSPLELLEATVESIDAEEATTRLTKGGMLDSEGNIDASSLGLGNDSKVKKDTPNKQGGAKQTINIFIDGKKLKTELTKSETEDN